jgi:hypothetical protein
MTSLELWQGTAASIAVSIPSKDYEFDRHHRGRCHLWMLSTDQMVNLALQKAALGQQWFAIRAASMFEPTALKIL